MIKNVVKSLVAVSTIVACGAAAASVVVYTDRSAWEAAVTGGVTENFKALYAFRAVEHCRAGDSISDKILGRYALRMYRDDPPSEFAGR